MSAFRVIVCGGRDYGELPDGKRLTVAFAERQHVTSVLDALAAEHGPLFVVEGGGPGASRVARAWREQQGHGGRSFEAEPAGPGLPAWAALKKRSREMVEAGGDLAVVFPGGEGTRHELELARAAGIPIRDERVSVR